MSERCSWAPESPGTGCPRGQKAPESPLSGCPRGQKGSREPFYKRPRGQKGSREPFLTVLGGQKGSREPLRTVKGRLPEEPPRGPLGTRKGGSPRSLPQASRDPKRRLPEEPPAASQDCKRGSPRSLPRLLRTVKRGSRRASRSLSGPLFLGSREPRTLSPPWYMPPYASRYTLPPWVYASLLPLATRTRPTGSIPRGFWPRGYPGLPVGLLARPAPRSQGGLSPRTGQDTLARGERYWPGRKAGCAQVGGIPGWYMPPLYTLVYPPYVHPGTPTLTAGRAAGSMPAALLHRAG